MTAAKKPRARARITGSMFYKHLACPHWLWFDAYGDPEKKAKVTKFAEMLLQMGTLHEERFVAAEGLVPVPGDTKTVRAKAAKFKATVELMKKGVDRIYHGYLMDDEFEGEPDLLERSNDRPSDFGPWHYVPVDIKSSERLSDSHKMQLSCYGELLARTQGVRPHEGYIINGSGVRIGFMLDDHHDEFHAAVEEIRRTLAGEQAPPHLSSSCKQSPWFKECQALAVKTDDIVRLYNVKKRVVVALREHGIRTVRDASRMDIEHVAAQSTLFKKPLLERMKVQAQALIDGKHVVRGKLMVPEASMEIFFDIEGDPLRQVEYLFGFLVRRGGVEDEGKYEYQIAERPEDESKMWAEFLEWIEGLTGEYVVYHYGTYEVTKLNQLAAKYGGSVALDRFIVRLCDLNEIVKECIVFPLHFYGIKDIGKYIGFKRSGSITGGGESVAFYEEWLEKKDRKMLDAIIEYNKDDVEVTLALKDWLMKEAERPHE